MGLDVQEHVRRVEVNFSEDEIKEYERVFQRVNKSKTGCVSSLDLRNMLKEMGEEVSDKQLHDVIAEVDTNRNSCVELDEFLQVRKLGRLRRTSTRSRPLSLWNNPSEQAPFEPAPMREPPCPAPIASLSEFFSFVLVRSLCSPNFFPSSSGTCLQAKTIQSDLPIASEWRVWGCVLFSGKPRFPLAVSLATLVYKC